ncbi:A-kinase anchor protein inhibitor 1 [Cygnus atratus]|uniref:A-kinase anchor protein inhibitor 1 n=1 Tax=Cygnus atratus TaxID=8868 RepID=UPI0021B81F63|nr:A-kinase anchor protein inhibitor 1 [Cygnus atratus]
MVFAPVHAHCLLFWHWAPPARAWLCLRCTLPSGEKPGPEQDEVKLQNASKQIVQTAILQAVQQVSQESQQKERRTNSSMSLQLERGKLTKKHEKK